MFYGGGQVGTKTAASGIGFCEAVFFKEARGFLGRVCRWCGDQFEQRFVNHISLVGEREDLGGGAEFDFEMFFRRFEFPKVKAGKLRGRSPDESVAALVDRVSCLALLAR